MSLIQFTTTVKVSAQSGVSESGRPTFSDPVEVPAVSWGVRGQTKTGPGEERADYPIVVLASRASPGDRVWAPGADSTSLLDALEIVSISEIKDVDGSVHGWSATLGR